jgi:RHS repeat-associated protein
VANPWLFTGAYYDSALKFYKIGQRYYDPSTARWTQPDGGGAGYLYAGDDPVSAVDPTGQWFIDLGVSGGNWVGGIQFNTDGFVLYSGAQISSDGSPGLTAQVAPMAELRGNQTSYGVSGFVPTPWKIAPGGSWSTSDPQATANDLAQGNLAGAWQSGDWEVGASTGGSVSGQVTQSSSEVSWSSVWDTVTNWVSGLF